MMQAHFDLRSAQEHNIEVRDVKGIERGDVRRGSRKVETKFGEVEFLPIATGVIEGACRYLVEDRMARTGAR